MEKLPRNCICMLLCPALLCLSACGGMQSAPAASASAAVTDAAPVNLSWYVHYNWFSAQWGGNAVSDAITEKTGVSINFITPTGNETEKLDALIASGSLPDLVTIGWWEPQLQTLISNGYALALNELADAYCPQFYNDADEVAIRWYTQSDGNFYCYPNSSYLPQDYAEDVSLSSNQTFLVRKDIYEAIGSPDMTTPEGFSAAVRAAAAAYPTVENGKPLIPIGAHAFTEQGCDSFDKFLMNFLAVPYEKDGKVYDRTTDPDYITWLKTLRQLGQEGYLADDIFLDQRAQMEEKMLEGRYFCMLYQRTDIIEPQRARYAADPNSAYIAVDGPKNAAGDDYTLPGGGVPGWTVTLISKNCANPGKAIQFMDFLMSEEGQKLTSVGVEGENYTMQGGKAVFTPETQKLYDTDYPAFVAQVGADNTYWMLQDNTMQARWRSNDDPALSQMQQWAWPYTVYTAQYDLPLADGSAAETAEHAIQKLWGKTLPQLLLAPDEATFDDILAGFIAQRDALGFAEVQAAATLQMQAAKEKLGMR
ncbi:MAG: extracellular solute-binding protein [Gemmiger sp.]|nr:extracellular solute-binding protein [Gemmiger sp.]